MSGEIVSQDNSLYSGVTVGKLGDMMLFFSIVSPNLGALIYVP